jgi:nucleoside-diphosphate-sugar epimerase
MTNAPSPLPAGPIVVTGATGFIGQSLVAALRAGGRGLDVIPVSRHGARVVDLREAAATAALIQEVRPGVVFHLAGLIFSQDLDALYASNVGSTRHLLDAVMRYAPACRVVVPGSAAEFGRVPAAELPIDDARAATPVVPYGLSKAWQTATASFFGAQGANVVVARLFNVVGVGAPEGLSFGAFAAQLRAIMRGEAPRTLRVGDLAPRRDFIDVADACAALLALAALPGANGVFNACRGSSVSIGEMLRLMISASGIDVEVVVDEARLRHRTEISDSYGSNARLRAATGWLPVVPLRDSVAGMLRPPASAL